MVAAFLRANVSPVLVLDELPEYSDVLAVVAVDVVLSRATAVVFKIYEIARHHELHFVTEHLRLVLGVGVGNEFLVHNELAVGAQCVCHLEFCGYSRHVVFCDYLLCFAEFLAFE